MSSPASCKSIALYVGAHLDGQLDPAKTLEVEDHLATCESCCERLALDRALRGSLKKAVKAEAPSDVRARMLAAMTAEASRRVTSDEPPAPAPRAEGGRAMLRHWRTMLPLASAAAFALAWGAASTQPVASTTTDVRAGWGDEGLLRDGLLRDFVGAHKKAYPPEQRDPSELSPYVGVPVRPPQLTNATFMGARLLNVHGGETAAMLQYKTKGTKGQPSGRVTIFVYNPRAVRVEAGGLAPVPTAQGVRAGQADGYSVVVTKHDGVGYTIASDLDPDESVKIVNVVDQE